MRLCLDSDTWTAPTMEMDVSRILDMGICRARVSVPGEPNETRSGKLFIEDNSAGA